MRQEIQKWHNDVLALHQAIMFETLVHPFNVITDSVKSFVFENNEGNELKPLRGYFALKDVDGKKTKYFIDESVYDEMPLRVKEIEEVYLKESANRKSIILRAINPTPFRIRAEKCFDTEKDFIDCFVNFEHSNPNEWTLLKMIATMAYVGKTFMGICSQSEFGKSSIFEIMHSITQKSPVFQPRSIPGILQQITGDGNMVFDEVHKSNAETKNCMENYTLQVAGNKPVYINGAMKSANTKARYDVAQQSITYLYNLKEYYSNSEEFFDCLFSNNQAIDSRLLKIKLDGKLLELFDKNFDMEKAAQENKMFYMKIAKHLLWLKKEKFSNSYSRRYATMNNLALKGRKKQIYDEITWMIDRYSQNGREYLNLVTLLDKCIMDYQKMVNAEPPMPQAPQAEQQKIEDVYEDIPIPLDFMKSKKECSVDEFLDKYTQGAMDLLLSRGDIFETGNHTLKLLE